MSTEPIRLSKRMARTGAYSRHEADRLIANGHVTVDGVTAVPGTKVLPEGGDIRVNGKPLGEKSFRIYKFHKPRGVLSSYYDPNGKKNLSAFKGLSESRMGYSGRLDYESEGLMLFTGNGDLIYRLQRSEYKVEKEYHVDTEGEVSPQWLKKLEEGIFSEGEQFLPCTIECLGEGRYKVTLIEGKKRQVRRMFKQAGTEVKRLVRVRIANIKLKGLPAGELRELTKEESEELYKCIK